MKVYYIEKMKEINIKNPFAAPVFYTDEIDSTMNLTELLENPSHGTILAAGVQTAGRGRIAGRVWDGGMHENLYFSMYINSKDLEFPLTSLSVRIALAEIAFLGNEYSIRAEVKWPNDVLAGGKKISGILLDSGKKGTVIGCGINCLQKSFGDFRTPATSISMESGSDDKALEVLEKFLPYLHREITGSVPIKDRRNLIYGLGTETIIKTGHPEKGETVQGIITGFSEDGSLLLKTENGSVPVYSGEFV